MKALVLKEQSFQLEEVENPILQKDQALVKVHFAALNHRDQWIREGDNIALLGAVESYENNIKKEKNGAATTSIV